MSEIKCNFVTNLKFSGESEFYSWKGQIEIETKSYFINKHGTYATKTYLKKQFICHRSGTYKPEGSGARHLKVQGTNKINGYCPAEICLKVLRNGFCEVNFQTVHIGHSQDLGHLTLSKSERETVAAKIAAKIPFDTIIDEVRNESIAENKFERMHLLKKKDLYNIEQCFNLNNEAVRHAKDAVSVDAWVKEVEHTGCILLYKPQDTLSDTFTLLREEDFLLIIMNYGQEEMLVKYGSDCICIDGTHGLNGYEFELVTLLVLDDMREGFPSTFLISNRTDEVVMSVFFSVIENKLGKKLQPNIFMSDMAHSFYNAWMQVMGPVQYRLFCTWHVDRAWKKNLCKIKTKEKQVSIYKMLRTLLQERDENAFIQMCNNFMDILISDSDTYEFGTYFREYYLKNIQSWAYCYRVNCGINTNMHLERMHRTLKHIYLKGRVIKRLDKAINILMKFIRDKLFDRLIVMNKGKICSKIHALRSRHKTSETLDYKLVVKTETGFEVPSTSTNEIYLIQERQPSCTCKLICTECQICLHRYSCTCIDSCIKWNMCKHVHLIQRFLKNDSVNRQHVNTPGPAESDDNKLIISENLQTCEQEQNTLFEAIINGKEKKHMGELNSEKDKLKLYLMKLADDIETSEELTTVKKLIAPVEPTLAAMRTEKINMSFCSKILKRTPYNKQITQQRRLYKTKKAASKQSKILLKPDDVENIAINLMYPPKHV